MPAQHIQAIFNTMRAVTAELPDLIPIFSYVQDTWMGGSVWNPEDWSVYGQPIRTNNDVEGTCQSVCLTYMYMHKCLK